MVSRISSSLPSFCPSARSAPSCLLLALALALALTLGADPAEARSVSLPNPQCHPDVVNTMRPRIKQICKALEAIFEFSGVMENYLDEKDSDFEYQSKYPSYPEPPAYKRARFQSVKRKGNGNGNGEDVDHVFLRFGKRG